MKRTLLIPVLILFFLALALTGCTAIGSLGGSGEPTPLPVVTESAGVMAEGRVVPAEFAALSFAVRGEVAEINAAAGDRVDRGTVLIRLEDVESLQAALDAASLAELSARHQLDTLHRTADIARVGAQQELIAASLAVSQARMALDEYTTQEFRNELDDRELDVQEAKDDLEEKQDTLDKYLNLEEDNPTRKSAQQDVDEALAALHEAEYERDLLQAQHDQAQAALDLANGRIDVLMADYVPVQALVAQNPDLQVVYHGELSTGPINIVLPDGDTALKAEVDRIIKELQDEGFIDQLAVKYFSD